MPTRATTPSASAAATADAETEPPLQALIVDDDAPLRELVRTVLEGAGVEVDEASKRRRDAPCSSPTGRPTYSSSISGYRTPTALRSVAS